MIYLDNGATSYPKPKEVADAVYDYIKNVGSNVNRGGYKSAYTAGEVVLDTREQINEMFNGYGARNVIFTPGETYGLNFLIKGLARNGDKWLASGMEHNASYRPLEQLKSLSIIDVDYMPCNRFGQLKLDDALKMIDSETKAVVMVHASNVSGTLMPIEEVGMRCMETGTIFIVDAAQTAGMVPIDMKKCHISAMSIPGHKSMMGPQGIGAVLIDPNITSDVIPLICGGTGSHSEMSEMPEELPDRFEAGTLNIPGIYGLHAAIAWLKDHMEDAHKHEMKLTRRMLDGFAKMNDRVKVAGLPGIDGRVAVISIDCIHQDNAIIAFKLEQEHDISTRVGLHCAPLAHKSLGTFPQGTIRFSIGPFNTEDDIDMALQAVSELV